MKLHVSVKRIAAVIGLAMSSAAFAQVKIGFIDPLSGMMGAAGEHSLREVNFAAEKINASGGVFGKKLEVVPFDNKLSPQESLAQLNRAIDQGIRYIIQGNGSSVALALSDAIAKHNARNPEKSVLFLNYASNDPDLTNSRCNFWHFRFDAHSDMKLEAVGKILEEDKKVKKVFVIGQDYSYGHQVSKGIKAVLSKRRPDVQIVGDDLHPIARVKDFSPYVAKIKASGADTVITGNWGNDLTLLIRAAKEAGLSSNFYTLFAFAAGTPAAIGEAGLDRVKVVSIDGAPTSPRLVKYVQEYRAKNGALEDPYSLSIPTAFEMLGKAMASAKSDDPLKVAYALEGMRHEGFFGEVNMRASDHQIFQPIFASTFAKVDGKKVKFGADGIAEYGFREDKKLDASATVLPTTCVMERPAK